MRASRFNDQRNKQKSEILLDTDHSCVTQNLAIRLSGTIGSDIPSFVWVQQYHIWIKPQESHCKRMIEIFVIIWLELNLVHWWISLTGSRVVFNPIFATGDFLISLKIIEIQVLSLPYLRTGHDNKVLKKRSMLYHYYYLSSLVEILGPSFTFSSLIRVSAFCELIIP